MNIKTSKYIFKTGHRIQGEKPAEFSVCGNFFLGGCSSSKVVILVVVVLQLIHIIHMLVYLSLSERYHCSYFK